MIENSKSAKAKIKKLQILQIFVGPLLLGSIAILINTTLFNGIQKEIFEEPLFSMASPLLPLFIFSTVSILLLIIAFAFLQTYAHGLRKTKKSTVKKSSFVRMAADTLRTPLTSLRWMTELMLSGEMGKLSKTQKESVMNMDSSFKRLIGLTNELLEVMRISGGVVQYNPVPTDILELIRDTKNDSESLAGTKGIRVGFGQVSHDTFIMLDAPLLRHVLSSLIVGAVHLANRGTTLVLHTEPHSDQVAIGITYTGEKIVTKDFEPCKNKESNLDIVPSNFGELDLSISWEILESANANFWTVNKKSEHTLFVGLPNIPAKLKKKDMQKKEKIEKVEEQEGVERFLKDAATEIKENQEELEKEEKAEK
ncbi:MAG: HAMP domain-containing histidine kinase [Candidatus Peribacteraceae bacterium]|nr:HAMP domain-containing histidine kinase [Candidatus Peribacteraceae bacterium]